MHPQITRAIPLSVLLKSTAKPARGAPVRAARPALPVRRPNAGVRRLKLSVRMMRGVSQATQNPVIRPNPDERTKNIQYSVQLKNIQVINKVHFVIVPSFLPY